MDTTPRCQDKPKEKTIKTGDDPEQVLRMWNWQKMRWARRRIMQCHYCGAQSRCKPSVDVHLTGKAGVDEQVTVKVTPNLR